MSQAAHEELVLRMRAAQLAQPASPIALSGHAHQLLVFRRAGQNFALDVRFVHELLAVASHVELPFAPPLCRGLVSARGELLALFELPLLGASHAPLPKLMLWCGEGQDALALAIDEALDLVDADALQLSPAPEPGLCAGVDLRGFVVIDGAALLSDPRLSVTPTTQEIAP